MRGIAAVIIAGTLAACANKGVPATTAGSAGPIATDVGTVALALTAAERLAIAYIKLPRCPAPAPCSDPAIVAKIAAADNAAFNAVQAARTGAGTVDAAWSAIATLQLAVSPLKRS